MAYYSSPSHYDAFVVNNMDPRKLPTKPGHYPYSSDMLMSPSSAPSHWPASSHNHHLHHSTPALSTLNTGMVPRYNVDLHSATALQPSGQSSSYSSRSHDGSSYDTGYDMYGAYSSPLHDDKYRDSNRWTQYPSSYTNRTRSPTTPPGLLSPISAGGAPAPTTSAECNSDPWLDRGSVDRTHSAQPAVATSSQWTTTASPNDLSPYESAALWSAPLSDSEPLRPPKIEMPDIALSQASLGDLWQISPVSSPSASPSPYSSPTSSHTSVRSQQQHQQLQQLQQPFPGPDPPGAKRCSHCNVTTTPLWRRSPVTLEPLCNACGLYLQQRHKPRPKELIDADKEVTDDEIDDVHYTGPICSHCQSRKTSVWRRDKSGTRLCNACGVYARLRGKARPLHLRKNKIRPRARHEKMT